MNEEQVNKIMQGIGELNGSMRVMQQGLTARIEDIRADIRRLDEASNSRMDRIETNLTQQIATQGEVLNRRIDVLDKTVGDRISSLGTRVTSLENEDKKIIEKVARLSAIGGGVGGALAAVVVELIKRS